MNFQETINYVKEVQGAAYALNKKTKELFILTHEDNSDAFSDTIIWYSGENTGQAEYDPEDFFMEYEDEVGTFDFTPCSKDVTSLLDNHFYSVLEEITQYHL